MKGNLSVYGVNSGEPRSGSPEASLLDIAWLAGIVDGEGHIGAWNNNRCRHPSVRLIIVNTNWHLLCKAKQILRQITPFRVACYERCNTDRRRKNRTWSIEITRTAQLVKILTALRPFLIAKRPQATLALKILDAKKRRVTPQIIEMGEAIKWMNQHSPQPDQQEAVETGHATA